MLIAYSNCVRDRPTERATRRRQGQGGAGQGGVEQCAADFWIFVRAEAWCTAALATARARNNLPPPGQTSRRRSSSEPALLQALQLLWSGGPRFLSFPTLTSRFSTLATTLRRVQLLSGRKFERPTALIGISPRFLRLTPGECRSSTRTNGPRTARDLSFLFLVLSSPLVHTLTLTCTTLPHMSGDQWGLDLSRLGRCLAGGGFGSWENLP